jgi:polar amino acid transport system substrate-binding protein
MRTSLPALAALAAATLIAISACSPEKDSSDDKPAGGQSAASSAGTGSPAASASASESPVKSSATPSASASDAACPTGKLKTRKGGVLTVGTDDPAYPPWFVDDKPANGKGYESAVAFAVGQQLGYPMDKVKWTVARFGDVIKPGPKNFDIDLNEISITPDRAKAVDFSSGYYDVTQAIVALDKSKIANAKTIADLKGAKFGAQLGSTSYDTIGKTIKPSKQPAPYNTNDLAKQALSVNQIDGLVVDLPTAFELVSEIKGSKIVGQIPSTGTPEQFGIVLDKGSALTGCVTKAVTALKGDGTLAKLQTQWLAGAAGAPVLK